MLSTDPERRCSQLTQCPLHSHIEDKRKQDGARPADAKKKEKRKKERNKAESLSTQPLEIILEVRTGPALLHHTNAHTHTCMPYHKGNY